MMSSGRRRVAALAIAVAGVTAIAACSSGSSKSGGSTAAGALTYTGGLGSIPAATGTAHTSTFTWAEFTGASPNSILPINTSGSNSVSNSFQFQWQMFRPLYWTQSGATPELVPSMSLAKAPVWSNGGTTATIKMNGYKWSDGTAVTSQDVLFTIDVIKAALKESPSNWSAFVPGYFPDDLVSASTPDSNTLVLNLKTAVNPTWFEEDIIQDVIPLPAQTMAKDSVGGATLDYTNPATAKKIYDFLVAQNKSVSTYTTNPLWQTVDGPYKLTAYNATNGDYTLTPNTSYSGPHTAHMSVVKAESFTSDTAEFNALKSGTIDLGYIPQNDVPQIASIKRTGYNVFGIPDFGMTFAVYNYKDATGHFGSIVSQLYFRQAMAHLEDQKGYVNAFFHGAGSAAFGPIPAAPVSPFLPSNAATDPYPYSVSSAVSILKSHGWTVTPSGTDTCTSPGSGSNQCGAGIPAGTKLSFNLIYSTDPAIIGQQVTALASAAKQAGITINLSTSNFDYIISNYIDPAAPANENKWAMMDFGGETNSTYPTTFSLFNTGGANQLGDYSDPTADTLIKASIGSLNPAAVKAEASYLTTSQPVLFQPNPDYIWAWKTTVSGEPTSFANLTQYYLTPEFWYSTK